MNEEGQLARPDRSEVGVLARQNDDPSNENRSHTEDRRGGGSETLASPSAMTDQDRRQAMTRRRRELPPDPPGWNLHPRPKDRIIMVGGDQTTIHVGTVTHENSDRYIQDPPDDLDGRRRRAHPLVGVKWDKAHRSPGDTLIYCIYILIRDEGPTLPRLWYATIQPLTDDQLDQLGRLASARR